MEADISKPKVSWGQTLELAVCCGSLTHQWRHPKLCRLLGAHNLILPAGYVMLSRS